MILNIRDLKVQLSNKTILSFDNSEIEVNQGDKVAILGENGAGKTTLINTILGEIMPTSGEITTSFNTNEVGVVFQQNNYSDLIKVEELIRLVFPTWGNEQVAELLSTYQLTNLQKSYVKDLSTGEQQRLTLGLVLNQNKKIYFFDELTSGLDAFKRGQLLKIMKTKTQKATIFNISHYFEEINDWATKVLIISHGALVFYGSVPIFLTKYKHVVAIKTTTANIGVKNIEEPIATGDGYIYIVRTNDKKNQITAWLLRNKVKYTTIIPDIYTCYLQALAEEGKNN
ncbi:ATP-binding cassette domain-containing protein [Bombilactobacillus bombi]|uniref:ATP-binding cassette domain-containing protein n=1 Tax=Bombilactobacillus bombi TaxID=1303590 RepID=UPI0035EA54A5